MNETRVQEFESSMPRILRNRSIFFNVESNERKNVTIESVIERIQNSNSPIATGEISEKVNENKIVGQNLRKRKQEIRVEDLYKDDLNWITCVPKKIREADGKYEKAENVGIVQPEVKDFEASSITQPPFEDSSLDFWITQSDNWTNVQSVVEIDTEKIEELDVDDESLIIPLSSASLSLGLPSGNKNTSIHTKSSVGDKSQIDVIDLEDDDDHMVKVNKKSELCGNKIKKKKIFENGHTFSQENNAPGTSMQSNWYSCKICDKKYSQTFSLHRHQKSIHGFVDEEVVRSPIFTCNQCFKNYHRLGAFINHAYIHMREEKTAKSRILRFDEL